MTDWLRQLWSDHGPLLAWLTTASLAMLVVSLLTLPVVAVMLPEDFIVKRITPAGTELHRGTSSQPIGRRRGWRLLGRVLKNLAGGLLAVAGLAMLVLPGQGLLTLILALVLLDIPGKRKLEARLLSHPRLLGMLNRTRRRFGRPLLRSPHA